MNRSNYITLIWAVLLFVLLMVSFRVTTTAQTVPPRQRNDLFTLRVQKLNEGVGRALPQLAPSFALNAPLVVVGTEGTWLHLRKAPSLTSDVLDQLPEGTRVVNMGQQAYDMDMLWRLVRAPNGTTGWVASQYLQPAR